MYFGNSTVQVLLPTLLMAVCDEVTQGLVLSFAATGAFLSYCK
jgi:hypothetical protein